MHDFPWPQRSRRWRFAPISGLVAALPLLMMMLLLLLASPPAFALYKCVADRKTTFQELPCQAGAAQTVIRTPTADAVGEPAAAAPDAAAAAAAAPAAPSAPVGSTDQEKLDVLEAERLRREAAFALRDKLAQLANQQASCERNFGVNFSRGGPNGGITGAVFQQSTVGEANAAAARCIARTNAIQQEVSAARGQCVARGCSTAP